MNYLKISRVALCISFAWSANAFAAEIHPANNLLKVPTIKSEAAALLVADEEPVAFVAKQKIKRQDGRMKVRFDQLHRGVPIWGFSSAAIQ